MAIDTERRAGDATVDQLIARLGAATEPDEIQDLAAQLGNRRDHRAIRPLLSRLGDCDRPETAGAETAICQALVVLGVMCRCGEATFSLRPRRDLGDEIVETVHDLSGTIPWRYFGTRRI
jgi:hypothetical protein